MTGNEKMPVDKQENHSSSHGGKDDFRSIWFRPHMETALGLGFQWDVCLSLPACGGLSGEETQKGPGWSREGSGRKACIWPAESWGTRVNRQGGGFMDYLTGHVVNSMKHSIPRIGLGGMREDRKD